MLITDKLAEGLADDQRNVVVSLDGDQAFGRLNGDDFDIYWGAYLGTADEILIAGRLGEVISDIKTARARAGRSEAGSWTLTCYAGPTPNSTSRGPFDGVARATRMSRLSNLCSLLGA